MFIDTFIVDVADLQSGLTDAAFNSMDDLIRPKASFTKIEIKNCVADRTKINDTTETSSTWDGTVPNDWGVYTRFDAKYNGNLAAGSIEFSAETTSAIRIKRRVSGTFDWKTLYIKPVNTIDDFRFTYEDKLAAGNTKYDYAYVPVIDGEEGKMSYASIESKFDSYFIFDPDQSIHAIMNATLEQTYNQETSVQTTIGRKFPYVIKNGDVGYYSGTLSATFIPLTTGCVWDYENAVPYRRQIDEFLTNGLPKIIKDWQGNIYIVQITDSISQNNGDSPYLPTHNIGWSQIGDASSIGDLYDNGFLDTDIDR